MNPRKYAIYALLFCSGIVVGKVTGIAVFTVAVATIGVALFLIFREPQRRNN